MSIILLLTIKNVRIVVTDSVVSVQCQLQLLYLECGFHEVLALGYFVIMAGSVAPGFTRFRCGA